MAVTIFINISSPFQTCSVDVPQIKPARPWVTREHGRNWTVFHKRGRKRGGYFCVENIAWEQAALPADSKRLYNSLEV